MTLWPFALVTGGFELQADAFVRICQDAGLDAAPIAGMDKEDRPDIIHYWGLDPSFEVPMIRARNAGVINVVTALLPFAPGGLTNLSYLAKRRLYRLRRRRLLGLTDHLVVLTQEQRQIAHRQFGFPTNRISVIPGVVSAPFWSSVMTHKPGAYVIAIGNICHRKNQVALAEAARESPFDLVVAGAAFPGELDYFDQFIALVKSTPQVEYLGDIPAASPTLIRAYQECRAFALLSEAETQPVAALEAAVVGAPLLLLSRPYTTQSCFAGAMTVRSTAASAVNNALTLMRSTSDCGQLGREQLSATMPANVAAEAVLMYTRANRRYPGRQSDTFGAF